MNNTYLITGGAGFIVSNFANFIYNKYQDSKIIVLDLLTYAGSVDNFPVKVDSINDRFEFWYGDIKNSALVENLVSKVDYVIHFAAETHVTRSIFDNRNFFETDVIGTQTISNAVLEHKSTIKKFIHISTSEVYGTASNCELMNEEHSLNPMSPYAAAKVGADRLVYSYVQTYDIPATIIRPFNNYGPKQHLEKVIPRFITSALMNEDLTVHGQGDASRDWINVYDTCLGIDKVLNSSLSKVQGEVFNLGTGLTISIKEIALEVIKAMNMDKSKIKYIDDRPGQVDCHIADISKIKEVLNWEPTVKFGDGLNDTISWYKNNKYMWEKQIWMRQVPIILKDGTKVIH